MKEITWRYNKEFLEFRAQLKNKINHLDKNETDAHNQNVHHKEFIKKQ